MCIKMTTYNTLRVSHELVSGTVTVGEPRHSPLPSPRDQQGQLKSSGDFMVATLTLSTLPLLIPALRITKYSDLATVFPA